MTFLVSIFVASMIGQSTPEQPMDELSRGLEQRTERALRAYEHSVAQLQPQTAAFLKEIDALTMERPTYWRVLQSLVLLGAGGYALYSGGAILFGPGERDPMFGCCLDFIGKGMGLILGGVGVGMMIGGGTTAYDYIRAVRNQRRREGLSATDIRSEIADRVDQLLIADSKILSDLAALDVKATSAEALLESIDASFSPIVWTNARQAHLNNLTSAVGIHVESDDGQSWSSPAAIAFITKWRPYLDNLSDALHFLGIAYVTAEMQTKIGKPFHTALPARAVIRACITRPL